MLINVLISSIFTIRSSFRTFYALHDLYCFATNWTTSCTVVACKTYPPIKLSNMTRFDLIYEQYILQLSFSNDWFTPILASSVITSAAVTHRYTCNHVRLSPHQNAARSSLWRVAAGSAGDGVRQHRSVCTTSLCAGEWKHSLSVSLVMNLSWNIATWPICRSL